MTDILHNPWNAEKKSLSSTENPKNHPWRKNSIQDEKYSLKYSWHHGFTGPKHIKEELLDTLKPLMLMSPFPRQRPPPQISDKFTTNAVLLSLAQVSEWHRCLNCSAVATRDFLISTSRCRFGGQAGQRD